VRIARLDLDGAEGTECGLELGAGPEALEVAGWAAYYRRDFELALRRGEEAAARTDDQGVRASCLTMCGRILHASGRLQEAEPRLREAVAGAPGGVRSVAQVFLAALCVHQGRTVEGRELADRALLDPTKLAHPFAIHHGYLFRVLALGMLGRPVEALALIDEGRAAALHAGEPGRASSPCRTTSARGVAQPRPAGRGDEWTAQALARARQLPAAVSEMRYAACLDRVEGRLLVVTSTARRPPGRDRRDRGLVGGARLAPSAALRRALGLVRPGPRGAGRAAETAEAVIADCDGRGTSRYRTLAVLAAARARLAAGDAVTTRPRRRARPARDPGRPGGVAGHRRAGRGGGRRPVVARRRAAAGSLIAHAGHHGEGCAASSGRPSPLSAGSAPRGGR